MAFLDPRTIDYDDDENCDPHYTESTWEWESGDDDDDD